MALSENFIDCADCEATTRKRNAEDGLCRGCYALRNPDEVDTAEVPVPVLRKLVSLGKTRHPTSCNEEAPRFERVLNERIEEYSHNRDELGEDH